MAEATRRTFLAGLTAAAMHAAPAPTQIIDTHTHFYDPARPGGVPWPPKDEPLLYRTVLPAEYRKMAGPLGITGAIEVEASPLLEDNQWVLDLAAKDKFLVGTVGDLEPGKSGFGRNLERFHKNPLFLGIRVGLLWGRNIAQDVLRPGYIDDLKLLSDAGLEIDVVGDGDLTILSPILRITDRIPKLRVVIDHLPFDNYLPEMHAIGQRPQIYAKISNVLRRVNGKTPTDLAHYRPSLDYLWDIFGEDRVVYGSNWPVSDRIAPFSEELRIVREYFALKGAAATQKYFWKNSQAAYRWRKRA
ncbi:MAG TPA: amidohydrolase [Solibacterales bacterium]|nr:amidohydrolase [Bryobacterales bacterium]